MLQKYRFICFCLGCLLVPSMVFSEADFYVSSTGSDAWDGKSAEEETTIKNRGPFKTPNRALLAARQLRQQEPHRDRPIVVEIRGGFYELAEPLKFIPEDSGTKSSPLIIKNYRDEKPILSGGRIIKGWKVDERGRWRVYLHEVHHGKLNFSQLFVDGQRRYRPRIPNRGYSKVEEQLPPSPQFDNKGHDRFRFDDRDLKSSWHNLRDIEILALHIWSASRMRIQDLDEGTRIVRFTGPTRTTRRWGAFPKGQRYIALNVKEAFNIPGLWYLDTKSGELAYWSKSKEKVSETEVIAPRLKRLLVATGKIEEKQFVEHVRIEGLSFRHSNWVCPSQGNSYPQAEMPMSAAISIVGARHLEIKNSSVMHTGGYGLAVGVGSRDIVVSGTDFFDLGAGGIKIGHAAQAGSLTPQVSKPDSHIKRIEISNCRIQSGGRLHPSAVGIWIGHASENKIVHNEISDLFYTGISVGWSWGYRPSLAYKNIISYNHIHHIGQGVLSDMGGVYTLGVSPGTKVTHNKIHDIYAMDYGGWGLYTDEGSTGIEMSHNLVYRTKTGSFHQHYGRDNKIFNNILVDSLRWQVQRTRAEKHISFEFKNNIVVWKTGPLLGSNWNDDGFVLNKNVYFHSQGMPVQFPGGLNLSDWQKKRKQDLESIVEDPLFVNPKRDDYRLKKDSPAFKLGFKPLKIKEMGPLQESPWMVNLKQSPVIFERN